MSEALKTIDPKPKAPNLESEAFNHELQTLSPYIPQALNPDNNLNPSPQT